jgi:hypothetical protein
MACSLPRRWPGSTVLIRPAMPHVKYPRAQRTGGLGYASRVSDRGPADGTGFWPEAFFIRDGVDAIYDDMARPTRGAMFSTRHCARRPGEALTAAPVITEQAYYDPSAGPW